MFPRKLKVRFVKWRAKRRITRAMRSATQVYDKYLQMKSLYLEKERKEEKDTEYYRGQYNLLRWIFRD